MKVKESEMTYFTPCVEYYNNSQYNSCIIFTDGYAEVPTIKPTKSLLWVISSNGTEESIKDNSKWVKIPKE